MNILFDVSEDFNMKETYFLKEFVPFIMYLQKKWFVHEQFRCEIG